MSIHYDRKEYRAIKEDNPDLTWEGYKQFKVWESKNYNPKADKSLNALLKLAGNQEFTFDVCHKMGEEEGKPYPHYRICIEGTKGTFWLCIYCGYLCEVNGNRYNYHLLLSDTPQSDLKYDVDSRGQVIIHPSQ